MSFKIRTDASGNGQFTIDSTDVLSINTDTTVSLPTGTANGIAYLNGSKVLTSGSALTFDGTNLGTGGITFADASTQSTGGYTGFRNRIINGGMTIDQRFAGTVTPNTINDYIVDRFAAIQSTTGKLIAQQNAGSVTPPTGFTKYLGVTSQSSYTVGTGDRYALYQSIEGYNVSDFQLGTSSASTFTLSFWVRSSLTGTFGGCFLNNTADRSYPFTYTISASNTWEMKIITITGDTTGTWPTTNTIGLAVRFGLGSGSTYSAPSSGSWISGNYVQPSGTVSLVGTSGATFYITGVQLEKGSVATPFEFRPYGTELALCQRYYWASPVSATQVIDMLSPIHSAPVTQPIACLPTMRTVPTCSAPSVYASSGITLNSPAVATSATASAMLISGSWSASGGNRGYVIFNSGNLTASAEI